MAHETGIYRRPDSRYWWIAATLPNGRRLRQSAGTENRDEAEALLAKLKLEAYREEHFGIKPHRSWQEAVLRYLEAKASLRSYRDVKRICRHLHPYLGSLTLNQINGDVVWKVIEGERRKGNTPATINRYLATMRSLLRMARDEWQWLDSIPKIRMLPGEVERDRWLTKAEADQLIAVCLPHLAAIVRFALATGCRAREILGLEWKRVDLARQTAWLNLTKNGTPRGVPLNRNAVSVLEEQIGKHPQYCFTYRGEPIKANISNKAWFSALEKAGLHDFRFHDLRWWPVAESNHGHADFQSAALPTELTGQRGPHYSMCATFCPFAAMPRTMASPPKTTAAARPAKTCSARLALPFLITPT
jgi:integrase